MRRTLGLLVGMIACAGCASPAKGRAPTTDSRVPKRVAQTLPEFAPEARWLNAPPASLASLRGRVLFVQFAFPT